MITLICLLVLGVAVMLSVILHWRRERQGGSSIAWKASVLIFIFGMFFIIAVLIFQHNYYSKPAKTDLSQVQIADNTYEFSIDTISSTSTQGDYILIEGWAAHTGKDLEHFNTQLVLYQDSLEDALVFKLAMQTKTDVTTYLDDGYNYDSSGFSANIKSNLIGDDIYKIALLYNDTETDDGARIILSDKTFTCEEIN